MNKQSAVGVLRREIPTNYKRIPTILDEMYETFCKKQRNYGLSNISVGTSLETEDDIKVRTYRSLV